ncbi:MAG TPA: carbohydrate ABC transporter permease [Clostridiales bacterium]|nr:carbohydrate ABC transporter permease [Clostridiales bacterium]
MSNHSGLKLYRAPTDYLYMVLVFSLSILFSMAILVPLIFVVAASFSSPDALMAGQVLLWPVEFNLRGYTMVLEHKMLITGFTNTLIYAGAGTVINVVLTILAAYPLSRRDLKIRNPVMFLFAFTMLFSGGMIPLYLLVRDLKLINTRWAMLLPNAMAVWNVIITRTYFQSSLPDEMLESANIDGCDDFRFLWKIALPLSVPIIAVNVLLYAVGHWNSYFNALIYLNDNALYPLQLVLRDILIQDDTAGISMDVTKQLEQQRLRYLLQYSTIVVATVPVAILYPFVQKYFVSGIMVGAIKG